MASYPLTPPSPAILSAFSAIFPRHYDMRGKCLSLECNTMTLTQVQQTRRKAISMSCPDKKIFSLSFADEIPSTCSLFVEKGGFELMVQGLRVYKNILF